jgi:Lar family restriction alleviation protein
MSTIKNVEVALKELRNNHEGWLNSPILAVTIAEYLIERDKPKEERFRNCPFCGSSSITIERIYNDNDSDFLSHASCFDCCAESNDCDSEAKAIAAWNRRDGDE